MRALTRLWRRSSLLRVCTSIQQTRRKQSTVAERLSFNVHRMSRLRFAVPARIAHPRWRVSQARIRWAADFGFLKSFRMPCGSLSLVSRGSSLFRCSCFRQKTRTWPGLFSTLRVPGLPNVAAWILAEPSNNSNSAGESQLLGQFSPHPTHFFPAAAIVVAVVVAVVVAFAVAVAVAVSLPLFFPRAPRNKGWADSRSKCNNGNLNISYKIEKRRPWKRSKTKDVFHFPTARRRRSYSIHLLNLLHLEFESNVPHLRRGIIAPKVGMNPLNPPAVAVAVAVASGYPKASALGLSPRAQAAHYSAEGRSEGEAETTRNIAVARSSQPNASPQKSVKPHPQKNPRNSNKTKRKNPQPICPFSYPQSTKIEVEIKQEARRKPGFRI